MTALCPECGTELTTVRDHENARNLGDCPWCGHVAELNDDEELA